MPKIFHLFPFWVKKFNNGEFYDDDFSKGRYSTDASIYQIEPLGVYTKSKDDVLKL